MSLTAGIQKGKPLRRFGQQLSDSECEGNPQKGAEGVLSVRGEDGCPCGMPINFLYEDGKPASTAQSREQGPMPL